MVIRRGVKVFIFTVLAIITASGVGLAVYFLAGASGDQALVMALTALLTPAFAMANKYVETRAKASGIELPDVVPEMASEADSQSSTVEGEPTP